MLGTLNGFWLGQWIVIDWLIIGWYFFCYRFLMALQSDWLCMSGLVVFRPMHFSIVRINDFLGNVLLMLQTAKIHWYSCSEFQPYLVTQLNSYTCQLYTRRDIGWLVFNITLYYLYMGINFFLHLDSVLLCTGCNKDYREDTAWRREFEEDSPRNTSDEVAESSSHCPTLSGKQNHTQSIGPGLSVQIFA